MSLYRILTSLTVFSVMSVFSCTKTAEGTTGPVGPAGMDGQSASGGRSGIYGYMLLVNQFTVTDSILEGVTVSTMMGDSLISTTSDKTGKFLLPALKSGNYRIMFKKNGYDSIGANVTHAGGNADQFINIVQMDESQTTQITGQTIQLLPSPFDDGTKYIDVETTITGPPIFSAKRFIDFYFSSSRDLNRQDYLYYYNTYTSTEQGNQFLSQISFGSTNINNTRFQPGDTVFLKCYIVPPYSLMRTWFDTNTYQTINYPYVGDSLLNYFIWTN